MNEKGNASILAAIQSGMVNVQTHERLIAFNMMLGPPLAILERILASDSRYEPEVTAIRQGLIDAIESVVSLCATAQAIYDVDTEER